MGSAIGMPSDVTTISSKPGGTTAPARPQREAGIEWLRVLACVAIVAFHASPREWPAMIFGLEVFTIFTIALNIQSAGRRGTGAFLRARVQTLLVPWLFWWFAYAAWKSLLARRGGQELFSWFEPWRLLAGPDTHLWFLPFAFIATALAGLWFASHPPAGDTRDARRSTLVWGIASAALLLLASYAMQVQLKIQEADGRVYQPWRQWVTVLPAAVIGLAIVRSRVGEVYDTVALGMLWSLIICAAGASHVLGWTNLSIPYALAISLCVIGLRLRRAASAGLLAASTLTFVVFLLHPMLFDVWYFVTAKIKPGPALAIGTHGHAAAMTIFTVLFSAGAVWLLRKTPLRQVL